MKLVLHVGNFFDFLGDIQPSGAITWFLPTLVSLISSLEESIRIAISFLAPIFSKTSRFCYSRISVVSVTVRVYGLRISRMVARQEIELENLAEIDYYVSERAYFVTKSHQCVGSCRKLDFLRGVSICLLQTSQALNRPEKISSNAHMLLKTSSAKNLILLISHAWISINCHHTIDKTWSDAMTASE